jgi:hypothetical protein
MTAPLELEARIAELIENLFNLDRPRGRADCFAGPMSGLACCKDLPLPARPGAGCTPSRKPRGGPARQAQQTMGLDAVWEHRAADFKPSATRTIDH